MIEEDLVGGYDANPNKIQSFNSLFSGKTHSEAIEMMYDLVTNLQDKISSLENELRNQKKIKNTI